MHSQKVRTLLKSINNLKKEVARGKLEDKKNFQVQKIKRLEKDMSLLEISINALRGAVNDEDLCDTKIREFLEKSGPKQIRIASREELKMEINKYKNISMRLMGEMKKNNIKVPNYAGKANLSKMEDNLREEASKPSQGGAMAHLDAQSEAGSATFEIGGGFDGALDDSGAATAE